jgi:hypothetical protein
MGGWVKGKEMGYLLSLLESAQGMLHFSSLTFPTLPSPTSPILFTIQYVSHNNTYAHYTM